MSKRTATIIILFFTLYAFTHLVILYTGEYTNDEGYFLYSSTLAVKGQIPYKDFAFWQPPVILYVYGVFSAVFGNSLIMGRWFSFLFGLAALGFMSRMVWKKGNSHSLFILLTLICFNLAYSFDTSNVKTQSLSIFIYTLALYLATCTKSPKLKYFVSPVIMAIAAGTRASLLPAVLLFPFYIYFESEQNKKYLKISVTILLSALLSGFAVFYVLSDTKVMFGLLGFFKLTGTRTSIFEMWLIKDLLSNQIIPYGLFAGTVLYLIITAIWDKQKVSGFIKDSLRKYPLESYSLTAYLGITFIHFIAPVKYATHQNSNFPLLVMFVALTIGRFLNERDVKLSTAFYVTLLILCTLAMPFQQYPVDKSGGKYPAAEFREIIEKAMPHIKKNGKIFTFETILAYEGDYELLPGLTIGVENHFGSFGMSTSNCEKYVGVDNTIIRSYFVNREADVLIMQQREVGAMQRDKSGVSFEEVMKALYENYIKVAEFENIGQFKQKTFLFVKKRS